MLKSNFKNSKYTISAEDDDIVVEIHIHKSIFNTFLRLGFNFMINNNIIMVNLFYTPTLVFQN